MPENLDDFLDTAYGLATTALLQGNSTPLAGYFDAEYLEEFGMAGTAPVFFCKASDIAAGDVGTKTLTISGVVYNIAGRKPVDDAAFVRVTLRKA